MRTRCSWALCALVFATGSILVASTPDAQQTKAAVKIASPASRNLKQMEALREEVRHQLVTLPYYSAFDWLQAEVKPDGTVILMGDVTRPSLKADATSRVKSLESATSVVDNIEVLPLSTMERNCANESNVRFHSR